MLFCILIAGCAGSLYKAAGDGDVAAIKSLVASGTDINAFDGVIFLYTPLMRAAMEGRRDAVTTLLELGADPLAEDEGGFTAAKLARKKGHEDIAKTLDVVEVKRRAVLGPGAPVARPPIPPHDKPESQFPQNQEFLP